MAKTEDVTLAVNTFDAAIAGSAVDVRAYSGGETLVEKAQLEGKEFIVVAAALRVSEQNRREIDGIMQPNEYVSVTCLLRSPILADGEQVTLVVFNDGGSGIRPVIQDHIAAVQPDVMDDWRSYRTIKFSAAIWCRKGLRRSEYIYHGNGGSSSATTWYFG